MSDENSSEWKEFNEKAFAVEEAFEDEDINCIDCCEKFVWTAGEQLFFRDKGLKHPPKRCKACKKAKNERLDAIISGNSPDVKQKIEVAVKCAKCEVQTTVPFYPSQGRPVYCRSCFLSINPDTLAESK